MDKRFIKTHELIKITFLELLKTQNLEEISISSLCLKCNIHRKTFYAHFKNIMQIIDEVYLKISLELQEIYAQLLSGEIVTYIDLYKKLNEHALNNITIYTSLINAKQFPQLSTSLNNFIFKNVVEKKQFKNKTRVYQTYIIMSGSMSLYASWFENQDKCSIETISNACVDMCIKTFGKETI